MAHPHFKHTVAFGGVEVGNVFKQCTVAMGAHFGVAKFAMRHAIHQLRCFYLAAKLLCHGLHAVANTQHGYTQFKHGLRRFVGAGIVDAGVAA